MLSWIGMFLIQRTQKVTLERIASNQYDVISGVPQGTARWDCCFSYYTLMTCHALGIFLLLIRLFADDCFLYRTITGPMDNQILQDDLNALSKWERDWQMSFNIEKCHTISSLKMNIVTPYIILIAITTIHI